MILTFLRILFLRLRNNPLELLLVFVLPIVFFSIFAAIFSNGIATGSDQKLRLGWIAGRETALSVELRAFLESHTALQCTSLIADQDRGVSDGDADLSISDDAVPNDATIDAHITEAQRSGRYDLIIRLPADFPRALSRQNTSVPGSVHLVTDGQNPMAVSMVTSIVQGFFAGRKASLALETLRAATAPPVAADAFSDPDTDGRLTQEPPSGSPELTPGSSRVFPSVKDPSQVFDGLPQNQWLSSETGGATSFHGPPGSSGNPDAGDAPSELTTDELLAAALARTPAAKDNEAVRIHVENPQAATQENPRIAMYAAGIAVLFLLFSSTGNAATILEEAESGTLDRILISRAGLLHIVAGKWLGILLLGCLQITVMFVWAEVVFRIQLVEHLAGFCIMTFCTAAATASFAMLLATLCRTRAQLNAVSMVIILSMSAIGGSMIPRFAMSDRMKEIGRWTFNAWALDGYQKVFWFQTPLASLRNEVIALLGSSVLLGILTLMLSGRWKRG